MYGHVAPPTKVWKFDVRIPDRCKDMVFDELREAHRYRNRLVEIELERRKKVYELLKKMDPKLAEIQEQIYDLEGQIEECNDEADKKELKRELRTLRTQRKERKGKLYKLKKFKREDAKIEEEFQRSWKQAYHDSPLFWATKCAVMRARKGDRSGYPPRFRKFDRGRLAIQLQKDSGGEEWRQPENLFDEKKRAGKVCLIVPDRNGAEENCGKHKQLVRFVVGTEGHGKYRFADLYVRFHRDIVKETPPDAVITWVVLHCRRVGCEWKWSLQFSIASQQWNRKDRSNVRAVGIEVGWRALTSGEVRVAEWIGTDGRQGSITIPAEKIRHWAHSYRLQSIRDLRFNEALKMLCEWRDKNRRLLPEWWSERASNLGRWQSQQKLASLVLFWKRNRFAGDEKIFPKLDGGPGSHLWPDQAWRNHDKHLLTWQANEREGYRRWRKNMFLEEVRKLACRYKICYYENTNWSKLSRIPDSWKNMSKAEHDVIKRYRNAASVGFFLENIRLAFGECAEKVKAKKSQCYACGNICEFDRRELHHTCEHCGAFWDQDHNAAVNILVKGLTSGPGIEKSRVPVEGAVV